MTAVIIKLFNTIIKMDHGDSTVYFIKTKAVLIVNLGDKGEFNDDDLTKQLLNKVIERIVVKDEKTVIVHFKTGLIMEKTLS